MSEAIARDLMAQRFRSYLPVVIDLETGDSMPRRMPYWKLPL